jgi:hypothetical protein
MGGGMGGKGMSSGSKGRQLEAGGVSATVDTDFNYVDFDGSELSYSDRYEDYSDRYDDYNSDGAGGAAGGAAGFGDYDSYAQMSDEATSVNGRRGRRASRARRSSTTVVEPRAGGSAKKTDIAEIKNGRKRKNLRIQEEMDARRKQRSLTLAKGNNNMPRSEGTGFLASLELKFGNSAFAKEYQRRLRKESAKKQEMRILWKQRETDSSEQEFEIFAEKRLQTELEGWDADDIKSDKASDENINRDQYQLHLKNPNSRNSGAFGGNSADDLYHSMIRQLQVESELSVESRKKIYDEKKKMQENNKNNDSGLMLTRQLQRKPDSSYSGGGNLSPLLINEMGSELKLIFR